MYSKWTRKTHVDLFSIFLVRSIAVILQFESWPFPFWETASPVSTTLPARPIRMKEARIEWITLRLS